MKKHTAQTSVSGVVQANLDKLERLRRAGIDPYPYGFSYTHAPDELRRNFQEVVDTDQRVAVASRVVAQRTAGKHLSFLDLAATVRQVHKNRKIQIMVRQSEVDEQSWSVVENLSLGDWVGVEGRCVYTRKGEPTIQAIGVKMLCKTLTPIPIPKVYRGKNGQLQETCSVEDTGMLWRYPELDMLTGRKAEVLVIRGRILEAVRKVLIEEYGCVDIETPLLNPYFGGAEARPFTTHLRALDLDLFLAISPEIELKRAIVGGIGTGGSLGRGVFSVTRNFRNEGVDRTHNPEFTAVEVYIPFVDFSFMMEVTERIFAQACQAVHGEPVCQYGGHSLDFGKPWPRLRMTELIRERSGIDVEEWSLAEIQAEIRRRGLHTGWDPHGLNGTQAATRPELLRLLEERGIARLYSSLSEMTVEELRRTALNHKLHKAISLNQEWDFLILDLFDTYCESSLIEPCHVILHPAKSTVLCKEYRKGALPNGHRLIERFESFALGMELSNAYSELNDPVIQRELVESQAIARAAGKEEAMPHNEPFLRAIEMGLPPCGGLGIGIDRLVMLLTDSRTIRDVIAFPIVGTENG